MSSGGGEQYTPEQVKTMSSQDKEKLEQRVRQGETVVQGGTGGKSLETQMHLAEGRRKGGLSTAEKGGEERSKEMGLGTGSEPNPTEQ